MLPSGEGVIIYIYIYYKKNILIQAAHFQGSIRQSFYDPKLSADSVVPITEFRTSAILLLLDYKGKLLHLQAVRTYKGSRNIAPLILHPGSRYKVPPCTQ